jgi:hypothetical protein
MKDCATAENSSSKKPPIIALRFEILGGRSCTSSRGRDIRDQFVQLIAHAHLKTILVSFAPYHLSQLQPNDLLKMTMANIPFSQ